MYVRDVLLRQFHRPKAKSTRTQKLSPSFLEETLPGASIAVKTNSCSDRISSLLSQRSVKNILSTKSKMLLQYPEWTASLVDLF